MILLVTYDLKGSAGSHTSFFDTLKGQGPWWHYLTNTWLISTRKSPKELFEALHPHIQTQAGDKVLITTLGEHWGWLPKDAWEWITKHT